MVALDRKFEERPDFKEKNKKKADVFACPNTPAQICCACFTWPCKTVGIIIATVGFLFQILMGVPLICIGFWSIICYIHIFLVVVVGVGCIFGLGVLVGLAGQYARFGRMEHDVSRYSYMELVDGGSVQFPNHGADEVHLWNFSALNACIKFDGRLYGLPSENGGSRCS